MECGCKVPTTKLLLEGEYGADPVWCVVCQYNIELDELPVDETLQDELLAKKLQMALRGYTVKFTPSAM